MFAGVDLHGDEGGPIPGADKDKPWELVKWCVAVCFVFLLAHWLLSSDAQTYARK